MNDTLIVITKFILAVLLVPVVWAGSVEFHQHIAALPGTYGDFFFWGMFGFLAVFLFFYQFWGVYELGQKLMSGAFQFVAPVNRFIAKIIPFYLTVILLFFFIVTQLLDVRSYDHYFMFFAGFSFAMHIILTAQDLQEIEKAFIKPGYLFLMMLVCIFLYCIVVLLFDLALGKFMFPDFAQKVISNTTDIYYLAGKRILFFK